MNISPLYHAAVAVAVQFIVGVISSDFWIGAAAGAFFYIGREFTQAEYRWISDYGNGRRANLPLLGGFDLRVWQKVDPWLDWIAPTVAVVTVALTV